MIDRAYHNLHYWVRTQLGTPSLCENCERTDNDTRYEWANLSGQYLKDLSDWARLCTRCHHLIDGIDNSKTHCKNGHEFTPKNTRIGIRSYKNSVYYVKMCRECLRCYGRERARTYQKAYRAARKRKEQLA